MKLWDRDIRVGNIGPFCIITFKRKNMEPIYFVKKNGDGTIRGTGQWRPGDGINYKRHEQVSKKEWERINKEVDFVRPKEEYGTT